MRHSMFGHKHGWSIRNVVGIVPACFLVFGLGVRDLHSETTSIPEFLSVPKPSWTPDLPREPNEIVPESCYTGAKSWDCRGRPLLVERHGVDESERLVRLSVVVESSQSTRDRLRTLRAATHRAGERLLQAITAKIALQFEGAGRSGRPAWLRS